MHLIYSCKAETGDLSYNFIVLPLHFSPLVFGKLHKPGLPFSISGPCVLGAMWNSYESKNELAFSSSVSSGPYPILHHASSLVTYNCASFWGKEGSRRNGSVYQTNLPHRHETSIRFHHWILYFIFQAFKTSWWNLIGQFPVWLSPSFTD